MDLRTTCQQVDTHGLLNTYNRETADLTVTKTFVFLCNTCNRTRCSNSRWREE